MQIELIVPFGVKTYGAIVAALNDVRGNAGNGRARSAGYGEESDGNRMSRPIRNNRGLSPIIELYGGETVLSFAHAVSYPALLFTKF
jgi:hypothetical protein